MKWLELKEAGQLETIKTESHQQPVLIFKHSTRCSISRAVLDRLERNWNKADVSDVKPYFLDLLTYRPLSNQIALDFDVEHESPQAIMIYRGAPVYIQSHYGIDLAAIRQASEKCVAAKN